MTGIEVSQFDQMSGLFLVACALMLFRERNILSFIVLLFGLIFVGPLSAAIVAGLILWLDFDTHAPRWVQVKDALGMFFLIVGAGASDLHNEYFSFFGLLLFALDLGHGRLGPVAAALIIRQLQVQPLFFEVIISSVAACGLWQEGARFLKNKKKDKIQPYVAAITSLVVLIGTRDQLVRWVDDIVFVEYMAGAIVFALGLWLWRRFREDSFERFFSKMKNTLDRVFRAPAKWIEGPSPFSRIPANQGNRFFSGGADQSFWAVVLIAGLVGVLMLMIKGGLV